MAIIKRLVIVPGGNRRCAESKKDKPFGNPPDGGIGNSKKIAD